MRVLHHNLGPLSAAQLGEHARRAVQVRKRSRLCIRARPTDAPQQAQRWRKKRVKKPVQQGAQGSKGHHGQAQALAAWVHAAHRAFKRPQPLTAVHAVGWLRSLKRLEGYALTDAAAMESVHGVLTMLLQRTRLAGDPRSAIVLRVLARSRVAASFVSSNAEFRNAVAAVFATAALCDAVYASDSALASLAIAQKDLRMCCTHFWERLAGEYKGRIDTCDHASLANIIHAAATVGVTTHADLLEKFGAAVARTCGDMNAQNMSNVAWGLASLRRRQAVQSKQGGFASAPAHEAIAAQPSEDAALADALATALPHMNTTGVSQAVWAVAVLPLPLVPPSPLLPALASALECHANDCELWHASTLLWAAGRIADKVSTGAKWVPQQALQQIVANVVNQFPKPDDVSPPQHGPGQPVSADSATQLSTGEQQRSSADAQAAAAQRVPGDVSNTTLSMGSAAASTVAAAQDGQGAPFTAEDRAAGGQAEQHQRTNVLRATSQQVTSQGTTSQHHAPAASPSNASSGTARESGARSPLSSEWLQDDAPSDGFVAVEDLGADSATIDIAPPLRVHSSSIHSGESGMQAVANIVWAVARLRAPCTKQQSAALRRAAAAALPLASPAECTMMVHAMQSFQVLSSLTIIIVCIPSALLVRALSAADMASVRFCIAFTHDRWQQHEVAGTPACVDCCDLSSAMQVGRGEDLAAAAACAASERVASNLTPPEAALHLAALAKLPIAFSKAHAALVDTALSQPLQLPPHAAAALAWALAKLRWRQDAAQAAALCAALESALPGMHAREVAPTLWALSKLGLSMSGLLAAQAEAAAIRTSASMKPLELAMAVPAATTLKFDGAGTNSAGVVWRQFSKACCRAAPQANAQQLAQCVWALARARAPCDLGSFRTLQLAVQRTAQHMTAFEVANALWGLTRLRHDVHIDTAQALMQRLATTLPEMKAEAAAASACAVARLQHPVPQDLVPVLSAAVHQHMTKWSGVDQGRVAESLQQCGVELPAVLKRALQGRVRRRAASQAAALQAERRRFKNMAGDGESEDTDEPGSSEEEIEAHWNA